MKTTDQAIQELVKAGAALVFIADPTARAMPVAWWRRIDGKRHFWHAPGISDFDHHVLRFDREEAVFDGAQVLFYAKDGGMVAGLASIQEQEYDTERQKTLAEQIAWWRAEFERNEHFRKSLMEAYHESGAGA
jgi:hypothetical protein